jgi:hypothetical protein
MLQFIKKYFNKAKKTEIKEKNNLSLKSEISAAERKAKEDREKVLIQKNRIYSATADAIHEIFDVPSDFWYEELKYYEAVKNDARNADVPERLKNKCDEIVSAYSKQLKLINSKTEYYDRLINEYRELRMNLTQALKKISSQRKDTEQMKILEEHLNNVEKIHDEQFSHENIFLNQEQLKLVKEELDKTQKEFAIKKQVSQEIDDLLQESSSSETPFTDDYNKEIKRLTKKIQSKSDENE